jgi:hypothetical protein
MLFLFSTQKDLAAEQSAQAQQALTTAENDLTAFENKNGVQLDQTYSSDQQLYNSYLQQAASAQSSGNVSAAAFYNSKAAQVRQQLAQLAPLVIQFQGLQAKVTQAQSQLQTADTTLQSAEAQYAAADPSHTVTVSTTQQESLLPTLVKEAAPAFGAGLFLAVVIVALLELVARRPRQAEPGVSAAKRQPVSMES